MKRAALIIIAGVGLVTAPLWVDADKPAPAVAVAAAVAPASTTPTPRPFIYSEQPLTMGDATGIYVSLALVLHAHEVVDIEWTPAPGLPFLPIHRRFEPFGVEGNHDTWSRFIVSNDIVGLYRVVNP